MRFAFCNEGFGDRPWPAVCSVLAEAGYDGVEIAPFTFADSVQLISPAQRADIREAARQAGLEIAGLHWLLAAPEGMHLSHPDASVRSRTTDYIRHLADFCADLGGTVMVLGSPRQRGRVGDTPAEQTWRWAADTIAGALPTAQERGVTLCIEPLGPQETDFVNSAREARRLIEELRHPRFRLMLDVKAMCTEDRPPAAIIRENEDILAHVHANDENRQGPGFGEVDFAPILEALRDLHYTGYVSVEPFEFRPDAEAVARRSLEYLRQCLPGE